MQHVAYQLRRMWTGPPYDVGKWDGILCVWYDGKLGGGGGGGWGGENGTRKETANFK